MKFFKKIQIYLMLIFDNYVYEKIKYSNIATMERGSSFLNNLLCNHRHSLASKNI